MVRRLFAAALALAFLAPWAVAAEPAKKKKDGPVLAHIKLAGGAEEGAGGVDSPFGGTALETFRGKLDRITKAGKDENVKGLVLEFGGLEVGFGKVDELRRAIADFKKSGKKVFSYAESYGTKDYLVALAGDMIALPESGLVDIHGMRVEVTFYKDFFEKVNLKADFLKMGDCKTAAETYTNSTMSETSRKQYESLVDDFFEKSYVEVIAKSRPERKWTIEQAKKLVDVGMFTGKASVAAGLVDRLAYWDDFVALAKGDVKNAEGITLAKNYGVSKGEDIDLSSPFAILKLLNPPKKKESKEPKIAVIYAVGGIESGKGGGNPLMGGNSVGSDTIVEAIKDAEKDDSVKAIVLRIDSPGGSALASDVMWNEIIKCKKPIVASMGDVAASGGYYIAMGCKKIYAEPGTITGSIGVFGGKIVTGGAFNWAGMKTDVISRGANSGLMSSDKVWNETERKVMLDHIQDTYDQFLDKALAGRKKAGVTITRDKLLSLAGGRVWTGRQAKANGLIDELGTLDDAIVAVKKMAGVEGKEMEILSLPKPVSFMDRLADGGLGIAIPGIEALRAIPGMPKHLQTAELILRMQKTDRVWLMAPYVIDIK